MDWRNEFAGFPVEHLQTLRYPCAMHQAPFGWPGDRTRHWSFVALILGLCAAVFWPGLSADWGRDDFMQLAMARLVHSPWVFFHTDHFPLPNSVFRPLGFASFWLGQTLAGSNYQGHALFSFGLFAAIALALHALLLRFGLRPLSAWLATLLFIVHPIAVGTALWWSARFDVLALLFVLIALHQARMTQVTRRLGHLVVTLLAVLSASLSKEIGLIGGAAVFVLFQHWAWTERESFWPAQRASLLCVIVALGFLAWRSAVLGTGGSDIVGGDRLLESLGEGMMRWFALAPGYLSFRSQLTWPVGIPTLMALLVVISLLPLAARSDHSGETPQPAWPVVLIGLGLLLLPALLQAPVVRLNGVALSADISSVEAAMQSRLFFMSLAGLTLIAATLLDWTIKAKSGLQWRALLLASLAAVVVLGTGAHQQARSFAEISRNNAHLARQALDLASRYDWPESAPCHLVIEGISPPPEWSIFVSMDSVIKALYPDLEAIDHCFIHANYPTFFHLISSEHATAQAAPFKARQHAGGPLARRHLGGLTIVHLQTLDSLSETNRARLPHRHIASSPEAH